MFSFIKEKVFTTSSLHARGFTLIELLIVIAVIGVLATVIVAAIDPQAQLAKARDAQRRQDISTIANALDAYYTLNLAVPNKALGCELSTGSAAQTGQSGWLNCQGVATGTDWDPNSFIYKALVGGAYLKKLPVDPKNNSTYFYRYNPETSNTSYLVVTKLENPPDTTRPYFRCSNTISGSRYIGCKDVSDVYSNN